ncbi:hypothetical protein CBR_g20321 [Chara braunii]|uniref:Membrin n=1 Tax=Chara braunii TaxID=69332 RepID=A0A388L058_CHABU|nr:hypothetical protein CBR_g20321 [Chara braunii]|eukprot:GBG75696.1 hypothetical protein CBR_g20321 [Chara braunii]
MERFSHFKAEGARILRQHGDEYDEESQMRGHVHNSHQKLDEAFRTGTQVLQSYAEQRERLKSAQRKALDMLNTVGLSSSLLRMAERRQFWDRWLVYAGMVVTIVVVFGVWYLTH